MKKKLFIIGTSLLLGTSLYLGQTAFIGDKAYVVVKDGALLYSGLGIKTEDSGVLDVYGNVMVTGNANAKLETTNKGNTAKSSGGNIILRLMLGPKGDGTDDKYGQLWVKGLTQDNITGIVDKEFRDKKHGSYQQIGLPFYDKTLAQLSTEFGKTFDNNRYSLNGVFKYNNTRPRADAVSFPIKGTSATDYYMIGSSNLDTGKNPTTNIPNPNLASNTLVPNYSSQVYVLRGRPFSDVSSTMVTRLTGGGTGIDYGSQGENRNIYSEKYNTYLQDDFVTGGATWTNPRYGRDLYQFGNPYFTNLDLGMIGMAEATTSNDGVNIPNLQAVRFHPGEVTTTPTGGTLAANPKMVTYTSGTPVGDVGAIIKPMQTFIVKLSADGQNNANYDLSFNNLRRFKYTPRLISEDYNVNAKIASKSTSTVKQLSVIALDTDKNELSRTYYVVYPNAKSGVPDIDDINTQAIASSMSDIGTLEENKETGGADVSVVDKYWLYINEANENDFAKKAIALETYNPKIKYFKFQIHENAQLLEDNQSVLSTGKEFYIKPANSNKYVTIANNQILPVTEDRFNLYYDKGSATLDTENAVKFSRTKLAFNPNIAEHVLLFDPSWKFADVKVFDMSGKLIFSKTKVATKENMSLDFFRSKGTYLVNAISETGEVFNGKLTK